MRERSRRKSRALLRAALGAPLLAEPSPHARIRRVSCAPIFGRQAASPFRKRPAFFLLVRVVSLFSFLNRTRQKRLGKASFLVPKSNADNNWFHVRGRRSRRGPPLPIIPPRVHRGLSSALQEVSRCPVRDALAADPRPSRCCFLPAWLKCRTSERH